MNKQIIKIGKRLITIFSDDAASSGTIIYIHMATDEAAELAIKLAGVDAVLVAIDQVIGIASCRPGPPQELSRAARISAAGLTPIWRN